MICVQMFFGPMSFHANVFAECQNDFGERRADALWATMFVGSCFGLRSCLLMCCRLVLYADLFSTKVWRDNEQ